MSGIHGEVKLEFVPNVNQHIGIGQKRCKKCQEIKKVAEFHKHRIMKDGLRLECKECHNKELKQWRIKNPEKYKALIDKWRRQNPEKRKQMWDKWKEKNRERVKQAATKFKEAHPGRFRAMKRASDAKRRALMAKTYVGGNQKLMAEIYNRCPKGYHVDHIVPISKGGVHSPENLQYLPALINVKKNAKLNFDYSEFSVDWRW